jgi:hypothetical protein
VFGNRYELGYTLDDYSGWLLSILKTNNQQAKSYIDGQTNIGFIDATGTPVQRLFSDNEAFTNVTRLTGVELMKTYRYEPDDRWGVWEMYYGARFLQVHDRFDFSQPEAVSPGLGPDSFDLGIDNNIIGPQIGTRWSNKRERWTFDTQFRFMAGANFQNAYEVGSLTNTNVTPLPINTFNHTDHSIEFAPVGELRLDAIFQVSKAFSLKVGYTALAMTGISRASRRIEYTEPDMGIVDGAKNDHFFASGVNFGFEFNR